MSDYPGVCIAVRSVPYPFIDMLLARGVRVVIAGSYCGSDHAIMTITGDQAVLTPYDAYVGPNTVKFKHGGPQSYEDGISVIMQLIERYLATTGVKPTVDRPTPSSTEVKPEISSKIDQPTAYTVNVDQLAPMMKICAEYGVKSLEVHPGMYKLSF